MGLLGETLQQARHARGISLDEAERDTRIVRHYLEALEQGDFYSLPEPTVTRGLLRLYARYLGLDPDEALHLFPIDEGPLPLPPTPEQAPAAFRFQWLPIGGLLLLIFTGVIALYWVGGRGGGVEAPVETNRGGLVMPVIPGTVPDLRGVQLALAQGSLQELSLDYAIVEVAIPRTPPGIVYQQDPPPGVKIRSGLTITLIVSRSPLNNE